MTVSPHPLSPGRTLLGLLTLVGGVTLSAGAVIGVAAGVGAVWHATNPPGATPAASAAAAATTTGGSAITVKIENVKTSAGEEPAFVGPNGVGSPVLFQLHAGTSTTVTIVNENDEPHTFDSSSLGLHVAIPPGPSTVHFTVDPSSAGKDAWDCAVPCGAWVMAQAGYMQGVVGVSA